MSSVLVIGLVLAGALGVSHSNTHSAPAHVVVVRDSIQSAVDTARAGDTIVIPRGSYREAVTVAKPNITILARPGAALDGSGLNARVGIRVAPANPNGTLSRFTLRGLTVRGYLFSGVLISHVDHFLVSGSVFVDNEEYGVFPVHTRDGRITGTAARGMHDSGIYVGQSRDIQIDHNTATRDTVGIEVELATHIDVNHNVATHNSLGVVVQIVPGLTNVVTKHVEVKDNVIDDNDLPNPVTDPDELLSRLPGGLGVLDVAGDSVRVTRNIVARNPSAGIVTVRLPQDVSSLDPRLDPLPDDNVVTSNRLMANGRDPDPKLAPFPGADVLWDGSGVGNCWRVAANAIIFPPALPPC